jgi:hypothetical protein
MQLQRWFGLSLIDAVWLEKAELIQDGDALAVARKLMVLLHRLRVTGEVYEPLGYASSRAIVQQAAA